MWTLQRWSFDIKKSVITCFHSIIKTLLFETCGQHSFWILMIYLNSPHKSQHREGHTTRFVENRPEICPQRDNFSFSDAAVAKTSALVLAKRCEKRCRETLPAKKKFVKMFQNDRNGCHVSDLWCFEFPHCCIRHCGSGQAVGTAAVLYFSIDPSLHVEHLELSRSGCRKHRECFCGCGGLNCLNRCTEIR